MPTLTYFADVNTVGNTTLSQALTVQGSQTAFAGSVLVGTDAFSILGRSDLLFSNSFSANANTTTMNVISIAPLIGIGTTVTGATLGLSGNATASNGFQTSTLNVVTVNATSITTTQIYGPAGLVGLNMVTPGASLHTTLNVTASQILWSPNVIASCVNASSILNTAAIYSFNAVSNVFGLGFNLGGNVYSTSQVAGNVTVSNSINANISSATTTNTTALTTLVIYGPGPVGVGTATNLGSNLQIAGNVWASNAISAPTIIAASWANATVANVTTFATSVNMGGTTAAANVFVSGNLWASNALSAPTMVTTTGNVLSVSPTSINTQSNVVSNTYGIGVGRFQNVFAAFQVEGNVWVSNAATGQNVITVTSNISDTLNVFTIQSGVGVGAATPGPALAVSGNVFVANSIQTVNVISQSLNISSIELQYFSNSVGLGTLASPATITIAGNTTASNSLQTTNTTSTNLFVTSFSFPIGIGTSSPYLLFGNLWASNAIHSQNIIAQTANVRDVNVARIDTPPITWSTNIWASNSFGSQNVFSLVANIRTLNVLSINVASNLVSNSFGLGINKYNTFATVDLAGNVWVSNALQTPNVLVTTANVGIVNVANISTMSVGSAASGARLGVAGNLWASGVETFALYSSNVNVSGIANVSVFPNTMSIGGTFGATLTLVNNIWASNAISTQYAFVPTVNIDSVNVLSIYTSTGRLGIGTSTPTANLHIDGTLRMSNTIQVQNEIKISTINIYLVANTNFISVNTIPTSNIYGLGINKTSNITSNLDLVGNLYVSNGFQTTTVNVTSGNVETLNAGVIYFGPGQQLGIRSPSRGANLYVFGDLSVTNAATVTSLSSALTLGIPILNVASIYPLTTNVTIGPNIVGAGDATLFVPGDITGADMLRTNTVITTGSIRLISYVGSTNVIGGPVGFNKYTPAGAQIDVPGNVYARRDAGAETIFASGNILPVTTNAAAISGTFGSVGIQTTGQGSTLYLLGNLPVSTNVTANNIFTGSDLLNVSTIYVGSAFGRAGRLGLQQPPSGASLRSFGNMYSTNSISTTNLISTGTFQYIEDATLRYPHLRPSATNANGIQTWIQSVCGPKQISVPNWYASARTSCSNVLDLGFSPGFTASVLLPDSRVCFVPGASSNIGVYNTKSRVLSMIVPLGDLVTGGYAAGILMPNGNALFVPSTNSNVGMYNPISKTFSNYFSATGFNNGILIQNGNVLMTSASSNIGIFNPNSIPARISNIVAVPTVSAVMLPNGTVICSPSGITSNIIDVNPLSLTYQNACAVSSGLGGVVLAPNGNVILAPTLSSVGVYNPGTRVLSVLPISAVSTTGSFNTGTLLPTGNILFYPGYSCSNVGTFDPVSLTYSNLADTGIRNSSVIGGTLTPSGQVVLVPRSQNVSVIDTVCPAPYEFCMSPYFNKF
jgi:hypothetical protein